MKHIIRVLIIGIFPILIAGCSLVEEKTEESANIETKEEKEDQTKRVGLQN